MRTEKNSDDLFFSKLSTKIRNSGFPERKIYSFLKKKYEQYFFFFDLRATQKLKSSKWKLITAKKLPRICLPGALLSRLVLQNFPKIYTIVRASSIIATQECFVDRCLTFFSLFESTVLRRSFSMRCRNLFPVRRLYFIVASFIDRALSFREFSARRSFHLAN